MIIVCCLSRYGLAASLSQQSHISHTISTTTCNCLSYLLYRLHTAAETKNSWAFHTTSHKTADAPTNANDEQLTDWQQVILLIHRQPDIIYRQKLIVKNYFQALQLKIQGLFKYFQGSWTLCCRCPKSTMVASPKTCSGLMHMNPFTWPEKYDLGPDLQTFLRCS